MFNMCGEPVICRNLGFEYTVTVSLFIDDCPNTFQGDHILPVSHTVTGRIWSPGMVFEALLFEYRLLLISESLFPTQPKWVSAVEALSGIIDVPLCALQD